MVPVCRAGPETGAAVEIGMMMEQRGQVPQPDGTAPARDHEDMLARLDDLSCAELDTLPFGVVQVDGAGRVVFYSAAESRFSGRPVEAVVGRDFFRDVA